MAAGSFAEECHKTDEKSFDAPPPMIIDTARTYFATIETEKGNIVLELYDDEAPVTANNFVFLACRGFYDGLTFHRVIPGFVAQGGDPTGLGAGNSGYFLPDEQNDLTHEAGVIAMARDSLNRVSGSQFYITYTPQYDLDDLGFTVFGHVIEGMDVLEQLTPRDPATNPNAPPGDKMITITIEER
jgi:peptidylprolyl isomerase